jgi:anthranilate phosphoribosyltransferase
MLNFLHRVVAGEHLSAADAEQAMDAILSGAASPAQVAALLTALRMKGETADEVAGFARAMRRHATTAETGLPLVADTCGTGGDSLNTLNISTIAAFAVAGAGVPVAKHGNRSISGRFGSADLMEALGVRITMTPAESARALREAGIGFFFAPHAHPAMRNVQPVRSELRMRTVFNLLGPLANPAGANVQVVGAPSPAAAEILASALHSLNVRGFVVHGEDGMDEITLTAPTRVWPIGGEPFDLTPEDFGVARAPLESLQVDPLAAARAVLAGERSPARDIVVINAAALLVAAGKAANWKEGYQLAARSIDSGAAQAKLDALIAAG